jgi:hypothetical protein
MSVDAKYRSVLLCAVLLSGTQCCFAASTAFKISRAAVAWPSSYHQLASVSTVGAGSNPEIGLARLSRASFQDVLNDKSVAVRSITKTSPESNLQDSQRDPDALVRLLAGLSLIGFLLVRRAGGL